MRKMSIISLAFGALAQRKTRTILTTLGIVIGIMMIVAITSLSAGFKAQISNRLTSDFQVDLVTVTSGGMFGGSEIDFEQQDVENISKFSGVILATGIQQSQIILFNGDRNTTAILYGVNFTEFIGIYSSKLTFANGSLPSSINNNTLILGFRDDPIAQVDQNVTIQFFINAVTGFKNATFEMEGIFVEVGFTGMTMIDRAAFIPLETLQAFYAQFGAITYMDSILVKVDDPDNADQVGDQIKSYFNGQVEVIVASSFISSIQSILNTVTGFLLTIGSIALLVAGISIMNIMLVAVMERTREIGILKALGARNRTVLSQFLTEAGLIGLIGGLIGIPVGIGVAALMGYFLPTMFSSTPLGGGGGPGGFSGLQGLVISPVVEPVTIVLAILFGLLITIVFALYPARKASKLDPVTALRYE